MGGVSGLDESWVFLPHRLKRKSNTKRGRNKVEGGMEVEGDPEEKDLFISSGVFRWVEQEK